MPSKVRDGDFWVFPIGDGYGFVRVRNAGSEVCAVYGMVFDSDAVPLSEVARAPIAFNVACILAARGGGYRRVGNEELPDELREPVWFWREIVGDPDKLTLSSSDGESHEAPYSAAEGLESEGCWTAEELAERLLAWLDGKDPRPEQDRKLLEERPWL